MTAAFAPAATDSRHQSYPFSPLTVHKAAVLQSNLGIQGTVKPPLTTNAVERTTHHLTILARTWMDRHEEAVAVIATSVRRFHQLKVPFRIYHGSTNSTRASSMQRDKVVDISHLSHILQVDTEARTVLVEPNVPMDRLVQATLKYGLVPPIVMEFPGITVGGGFAGTGGESSSFKYGFFDSTVNWIEMVLADGQVVYASKSERPDLFDGAAGTFGTLGITTLLELRLVKATTHVELTYHPVVSLTEAVHKLGEAQEDPSNDFVDGILFAKDRGVVVTGLLKDVSPNDTSIRIQRFSRARDPWYYLHAEKIFAMSTPASKEAKPFKEAVPLVDYLFRYDRGGFWVGYYAFKYFKTPFNRFTRWALDRYMHTRVMYHALHESGHSQKYMVQDLGLPYSTAQDFLEYLDKSFGFYPLWLCPLRPSGQIPLHPHVPKGQDPKSPEKMLNIGLWGPGPSSHDAFVRVNRQLEHKVIPNSRERYCCRKHG